MKTITIKLAAMLFFLLAVNANAQTAKTASESFPSAKPKTSFKLETKVFALPDGTTMPAGKFDSLKKSTG